MGGGVVANALQWLLIYRAPGNLPGNPGDSLYTLAIAGVPAGMSLVALWLAFSATSSTDSLARPLARSSQGLAALALLGAVLLAVANMTQR